MTHSLNWREFNKLSTDNRTIEEQDIIGWMSCSFMFGIDAIIRMPDDLMCRRPLVFLREVRL